MWSRWRFVRFATDEKATTTLVLLAECFEAMGGVPKVVLADRMGCLKGAVVANVVVPTPEYVRFATHYGFRPDFCEAADPESKGMVEHLVGYAKRDLVVPQAPFDDLAAAHIAAAAWCDEVNAAVHSEICAVPTERLGAERSLLTALPTLRASIGKLVLRKVDKLSCVRFGSARYSVPVALIGKSIEVHVADGVVRVVHLGETVAEHQLVAPGETSVRDEHYGSPRPKPRRAPRPRTQAEHALLALGPVGEAFLKGAAGAGVTKLASELEIIVALERAHGRDALVAALQRAVQFGRWRAADVRSIVEAGAGVARPTRPGEALVLELPFVPTRDLSDYVPRAVAPHQGPPGTGGWEIALNSPLLADAERFADEAAEFCTATPITPGLKDLILTPAHAMLTIHEVVAHATEIDRIMGYEANYAGTSFVKISDIGKLKYGSKLFNVTADKTRLNGMATIGYDDDGVKTTEFPIVREGSCGALDEPRDGAVHAATKPAAAARRPGTGRSIRSCACRTCTSSRGRRDRRRPSRSSPTRRTA